MYTMYSLEDVRAIFRELDKKTGLHGADLEIRNVNDTYVLGNCVIHGDTYSIHGVEKGYKPHHFEFSDIILDKLNGYETFRDVVVHEYCHYVATIRHKDNCNHDERFVKVCYELADDEEQARRIGHDNGTVLIDEVWDKWDSYIDKCQNVVESMEFKVDNTGIITAIVDNTEDVVIDTLLVDYWCDSGIEDIYSGGFEKYKDVRPFMKHVFKIDTTTDLYEEDKPYYKVDSCRIVVSFGWENDQMPTVFEIDNKGKVKKHIMTEEEYAEYSCY